MPFIQRIVQPVNIAQVFDSGTASVSGIINTKFHCIPDTCRNNNCINRNNKEQHCQHIQLQTQQQITTNIENNCTESVQREQANFIGEIEIKSSPRPIACVKDTTQHQQTITKALVHSPLLNADSSEQNNSKDFIGSFTYATDNEEDLTLTNLNLSPTTSTTTPTSPAPSLPLKKLKQHVEFLSSAPSPSRNQSRSADSRTTNRSNAINHQNQRRRTTSAPHIRNPSRIVTGFEFDSISNITLSNALRQLASLVLIASDIFDDLQKELQSVGERALCVQRKLVVVEQRVCAYDPKMVTVPESDLLTFAQRKKHYQSDKLFKKELFTADTRPQSVRQLYEDAGKVTPPPQQLHKQRTNTRSPLSINGDLEAGIGDIAGTGVSDNTAAGSDEELVCTPVFGRANRTMRTRIDAEIEIRLPAAIDDLRKWTSTEALGDVTVTPDCMHHVDTSICTSIIIGDNGVLTPALSPSVISADAVDALYSINVSNINDKIQIPNEINKDVPLNHRLPSPEEQSKIIALRYPAEIISVDTSGKRFQRMCLARKSTTGCYTTQMVETNNLNDDVQTISRRSRSRKVRGKRRNTIAGMDQKEIQDAANGETTPTVTTTRDPDALGATGDDTNKNALGRNSIAVEDARRCEKSKKFGRSKSSDILKKESVALPYDKGKSTLTRLNSLKQWGRNRFKFMQRNEQHTLDDILDSSAISDQSGTDKSETNNNAQSGGNKYTLAAVSPKSENSRKSDCGGGQRDIDDDCVVHELIKQKSESRFSHERKPSYSSSEKSMSVSSSGHLRGKLHLATCSGNVKLRDTSSLNRQRRNGFMANGFGGKDEQPHSSSGNWSASSESGRASIGSEITIQPKSSASNTSLNISSFHPGSGPPSSMLSRRRFMNTSASSSVTSDGTATPDLQVVDGTYPNHMDDETSSAYSCDTEGYYTSFHMDSGLRTLKEEETPITPVQASQTMQTSNYSFGSQSHQTVLTAENEYELFGRGSTSTTTSSAGTVCTTLMISGEQSSLSSQGPDVPERISSLGKLNRSNHSNSASSSTLERSYSSSTIGSTLERTGTIKRNTSASLKLTTNEVSPLDDVDDEDDGGQQTPTAKPGLRDDEFDFELRPRKRAAQPLPDSVKASLVAADMECSESSDLECVERIERIKQKTTINAKRIPSMCIITPTTSDDEIHTRDGSTSSNASTYDPNKTLTNESSKASSSNILNFEANDTMSSNIYSSIVDRPMQHPNNCDKTAMQMRNKDYNLNVLHHPKTPPTNCNTDKCQVVLPSVNGEATENATTNNARLVIVDDDLYADAGEYVYITDISNNNRYNQLPKAPGASGLGIYYSNDIIRQRQEHNNLDHQQHVREKQQQQSEMGNKEYISLNELPINLRCHGGAATTLASNITTINESEVEEKLLNQRQNCADAVCAEPKTMGEKAAYVESSSVPMYAEISELREEKTLLSPLSQQQGARLHLNAQGKIIYDSDSLKRRKGAHTTFAPGPYVKETESALPAVTASALQGKSGETAVISGDRTTKAALLLLNRGLAATRKIANVRPIVTTTTPVAQQREEHALKSESVSKENSMSSLLYFESQQQSQPQECSNYQEQKQMLANSTNPFFMQNSIGMMPSPSTKSTSSTGSSTSSTQSTLTSSGSGSSNSNSSNASASASASASVSSRDEGFQRFYKTNDAIVKQPQEQTRQFQANTGAAETQNVPVAAGKHASPFQRNTPAYWTLQNRRQTKPMTNNATTSRDDLYATPIRRSERVARAAAAEAAATPQSQALYYNNNKNTNSNSHIYSPIIPRNRSSAFSTSTPNRSGADTSDRDNWESPERLNTCADRIGHSKTSLMDFKKLLLAKSAKSSPVQRKLSAVELLKKTTAQTGSTATVSSATVVTATDNSGTQPTTADQMQSLNSSMKLLDLSGSPKTFANRRMLRQGQFGSPSKTFTPKIKTTPNSTWRSNSVQRTDIISTAIPEATNSEEDPSNSSGSGTSNSSRASSVVVDEASLTSAERFDLKRNFFLQTDENNFMRGELKPNFSRNFSNDSNTSVNVKFTNNSLPSNNRVESIQSSAAKVTANATNGTPALETAL